MKTYKSIALAALVGLMLIAGQSFAQRSSRSNRVYTRYQNIPNLTEDQKQQINEMRSAHLKEIAELRSERRSTATRADKKEIRNSMLQKQETHKNQIRALLNEDQKTYFDKNQNRSNRQANGKGTRGKGSRGSGNSGGGSKGGGNKGGGNRSW